MCRNKKPRSALGPGIQPWAQASSPVLLQDWAGTAAGLAD